MLDQAWFLFRIWQDFVVVAYKYNPTLSLPRPLRFFSLHRSLRFIALAPAPLFLATGPFVYGSLVSSGPVIRTLPR